MTSKIEADVDLISRIEAVPAILDVVCRATGLGFAAVARVTEDRWVACGVRDEVSFGLKPGDELDLATTICSEVRQSRQAVMIDCASQDPAFSRHPTPAMYGFESYVSMPIVLPDGTVFGTLCALDPKPVTVNRPETIGMFRLFAELIAFHLDAHRRLSASDDRVAASEARLEASEGRLAKSEASLLDARRSSELREQFIAVLGHDLRNPLAAVFAGAQILRRTPLDERAVGVLGHIENSVARMSRLIDDVLDFARGRLGGGVPVELDGGGDLPAALEGVVDELRAAWPERTIASTIGMSGTIRCDPGRIGQLLSNLIANALTHGAPDAPVRVRATASDGAFELAVSNEGDPIPPETLKNLFQPFFRSKVRRSQQGLGLGLYIASEIARAHGGTLSAASSPDETSFVFRMPAG